MGYQSWRDLLNIARKENLQEYNIMKVNISERQRHRFCNVARSETSGGKQFHCKMSCDLGVTITNESTRRWLKDCSKTNTLIIEIYSMTAVRSGNDINYNLFLTAVSAASLLSCQREWSSKYAADTSWGGMKWPAWWAKKNVHFLWNSTHLKWVLNEKSVWLPHRWA